MLWAAIAAMGLATFALRVSFLLLPEEIALPHWLRAALPFVPAAVLTALWAPELLLEDAVLSLSLHNEQMLAGAVALAVAWRFRHTLATIAAGLLALHLFAWIP